jgi:hypothetical protein
VIGLATLLFDLCRAATLEFGLFAALLLGFALLLLLFRGQCAADWAENDGAIRELLKDVVLGLLWLTLQLEPGAVVVAAAETRRRRDARLVEGCWTQRRRNCWGC